MTVSSRSEFHGITSDRSPDVKLADVRLELGVLLAIALVGMFLSYLCGVDPSSLAP